jgi:type 1 glutamine amidotransferase
MSLRACLLLAALSSTLATPSSAQLKNPEATPVLILSGGQREHHAFRTQSLYLSTLLEQTGRYRVTIVEDAAILDSPKLNSYQLIIIMADRRDEETKLTPSQQRALLQFVHQGHGCVSLHGADNAPADWLPEMKTMLGAIYSHVGQPDGKAIGGKTWLVKIADPNHTITRGLADFELADELYTNLQMRDDLKPLATIEYQDTIWPVAWTYQYGAGPVFHTTLAHCHMRHPELDPLKDPNLAKLITQGIDWVRQESANPHP